MGLSGNLNSLEELRQRYPAKFVPDTEVSRIFDSIRRGGRVFLSTGCGEPQFLFQSLIEYVKSKPKAFFDVEVFHIWTLAGSFRPASYSDDTISSNLRHNSFFVSHGSRSAVNTGAADYTPILVSEVPGLFFRRVIPIDVALVQTSLPDCHGYLSLGISVDTTKAVVDNASYVIAQINPNMPRTHGDGFIHMEDVDLAVVHEEPLLEYHEPIEVDPTIARRIGEYVASLVRDGDTVQVGYGAMLNAIVPYLGDKKHLGIHTELVSDGIVGLMKKGVIDNSRKTINHGKTTASFCMGTRDTYEYLHDNPSVEFRTVDYTASPLIIAQNRNMTAINSALEIDLTGQATTESIGTVLYAGIGATADFMRGAILAPGGKSILALDSTTMKGSVSRIVPFLKAGASVTLNRADIHYVVTEHGIAYLHGKNIRERAMEIISIAHPDFRLDLIKAAKKRGLIYKDQAFVAGKYPNELETYRTTKSGLEILVRPVKISDEPLLKDFFYSLSDSSIYQRFSSKRLDMPHERLQEHVVVDYTRSMAMLAVIKGEEREKVIGLGQYFVNGNSHDAEIAVVVRDEWQNRGVATELLSYLTYLAQRRGLLGFVAEVMPGNESMLHVFAKMGFDIKKRSEEGTFLPSLVFGERPFD